MKPCQKPFTPREGCCLNFWDNGSLHTQADITLATLLPLLSEHWDCRTTHHPGPFMGNLKLAWILNSSNSYLQMCWLTENVTAARYSGLAEISRSSVDVYNFFYKDWPEDCVPELEGGRDTAVLSQLPTDWCQVNEAVLDGRELSPQNFKGRGRRIVGSRWPELWRPWLKKKTKKKQEQQNTLK